MWKLKFFSHTYNNNSNETRQQSKTKRRNVLLFGKGEEQWKSTSQRRTVTYEQIYTHNTQKWPEIEMRCSAIFPQNEKRKEKSYFFENWEEWVSLGEHEMREYECLAGDVTYSLYTLLCYSFISRTTNSRFTVVCAQNTRVKILHFIDKFNFVAQGS